MTVYQFDQPWQPGSYPNILAIGDSWFWYPSNNILNAVNNNPQLRSDLNIQALGFNGALLQDYLGSGKFAPQVRYNLSQTVRVNYNVFMISGAGNDAVDYHLALLGDCGAITDPNACIDPNGLTEFLRVIGNAMSALISQIRQAYANAPAQPRPIFIHGYDYPVPDGRPFTLAGLSVMGPWLKPAMDDCKVNPDLVFRTAVAKALIDQINTLFKTFDSWDNEVVYIDSRGTLNSGPGYESDWANELHPTPSGFAKIVDQRWMPILKQWGMTKT